MTESEQFTTDKLYIDKLARLYSSNVKMFQEVIEYIPIKLSCSTVKGWKHFVVNEQLANYFGMSKEYMLAADAQVTRNLVRHDSLKQVIHGLEQFTYIDHADCVHSYFQIIKPIGSKEYVPLLSHKKFVSDGVYLNMYQTRCQSGSIGFYVQEALGEETLTLSDYQRYHSLTKREKQILLCITEGNTNEVISEQLFISPNTVRTHRNRIWKKLDIRHFREALKFGHWFERGISKTSDYV